MYRLPRPILLSIPNFTFYNPPVEAVRPRTVDPRFRPKFRRLRSLHRPAERPSTGVLRWEDVSANFVSDSQEGERRRETHGEQPFLLSDDGNRKTNFAGCVNEQFEITNVTGTLQGLNTEIGARCQQLEGSRNAITHPDSKSCLTTKSRLTLTTTGFEFTFHSPPLTARITSTFSLCVSAYMLLLTLALSASSIILPRFACSAPNVNPDTKTCPDRC